MVKMMKTIVNGEFEIMLPEHRALRPEWKLENGGWERKRLQALHREIQQGDDIYYIGAEEGDMAALCQIWGGNMFLFEPNPKVWPNIKAIWKANNLKDPTCFVGFASNITSENNTVTNGLSNGFPLVADGPVIPDHGFMELAHAGDTPQITIDNFVLMYASFPPDIISLDCEGCELQVLKGAEATLRRYKPKLFVSWHAEFTFRMYGEYLADARRWVLALGYKEIFLEYPMHELHMMYIKE